MFITISANDAVVWKQGGRKNEKAAMKETQSKLAWLKVGSLALTECTELNNSVVQSVTEKYSRRIYEFEIQTINFRN